MAAKSKKSAKGGKSKKASKKAATQRLRFEIEIEDDRVTMVVFPGGSRKLSVASGGKGPPIKKPGKGPLIKNGGKGPPIK